MKIIFDNEEQQKEFIRSGCPSLFDNELPGYDCDDCETLTKCEKCLEKHIEMEVKHD